MGKETFRNSWYRRRDWIHADVLLPIVHRSSSCRITRYSYKAGVRNSLCKVWSRERNDISHYR
jgi:hypothetical protein